MRSLNNSDKENLHVLFFGESIWINEDIPRGISRLVEAALYSHLNQVQLGEVLDYLKRWEEMWDNEELTENDYKKASNYFERFRRMMLPVQDVLNLLELEKYRDN